MLPKSIKHLETIDYIILNPCWFGRIFYINHLEALTSSGRPTSQWDDLFVFVVLSKLDFNTNNNNNSKWEDKCCTNELPTLK